MKRKIGVFNYLFLAFGLLIAGCSDYFDVRPKSQVLVEELFESEQGYVVLMKKQQNIITGILE